MAGAVRDRIRGEAPILSSTFLHSDEKNEHRRLTSKWSRRELDRGRRAGRADIDRRGSGLDRMKSAIIIGASSGMRSGAGDRRSRFHSTAIASASSRGAPIYCLSSRRSLGSLRDQEARRVPARAGHATPARTDRRTDGCRTVRRQCRNRFRQSQKAARQMAAAIRGRKPHVYITPRWRLVAWLLRVLPEAVYSRI